MRKFFLMYVEGFSNMSTLGKRLWLIILLKLFIMFAVMKAFFFPNFLKANFSNDDQRSEHILNTIINQSQQK